MSKTISILGCGWIGMSLKKSLEFKGHCVYCLAHDIDENRLKDFYDCETLVVAIPPSCEGYLSVLRETMVHIDTNSTQVIFLSSISFYDGKSSVVEAESLIQTLVKEAVILRLGGLMGYDRVAGKYTAGSVLTADSRTNYIHRDDVIAILKKLIEKNINDEVFDVVAPIQATKKEIFAINSKAYGFEPTEFLSGDIGGKVISPKKLIDTLAYDFIKPNVRAFWD